MTYAVKEPGHSDAFFGLKVAINAHAERLPVQGINTIIECSEITRNLSTRLDRVFIHSLSAKSEVD
jgi:hypothetical protein